MFDIKMTNKELKNLIEKLDSEDKKENYNAIMYYIVQHDLRVDAYKYVRRLKIDFKKYDFKKYDFDKWFLTVDMNEAMNSDPFNLIV